MTTGQLLTDLWRFDSPAWLCALGALGLYLLRFGVVSAVPMPLSHLASAFASSFEEAAPTQEPMFAWCRNCVPCKTTTTCCTGAGNTGTGTARLAQPIGGWR